MSDGDGTIRPVTCDDCGGSVDDLGFCGDCGLRSGPPATSEPGRPSGGAESSSAGDPVAGRSTGRRSSSIGGGAEAEPGEEEGDPRELLLRDPVLPERHRRCRNARCRQPVGQATPRRPGLVTGFCKDCGWGFSARPPLQPDPDAGTGQRDRHLVAGRYEVLGAIGRGGLGWVYLAWDTRIPHYVVLKGLLDPDDPRKRAVAVEEIRALARADHENIVSVLDVVAHTHPLPAPGGSVTVDYIVMAFVHGESLLDRLRARRREGGYLSVTEAAEGLLPAMAAVTHLHRRELIHNDVKPDNVMVARSGRVFLVDLGAVSHPGRHHTIGTVGYRDPAPNPRSPQTDVYSFARSLAGLTMEVPGFAEEHPLPALGAAELDDPRWALLARHESFHRLLLRATDPEPDRRFVSVTEMADQLRSVVREVEAAAGGPRPGLSELFGPELRVVGAAEFPRVPAARAAWALALPEPLVDPTDPHARALATLRPDPGELVAAAEAVPDPTTDVALLAARARIGLLTDGTPRDRARVDDDLQTLLGKEPADPRIPWLQGVAALVVGDHERADERFDEVRRLVPGEAAPQLAQGVCAELRDDPQRAAACYRTVWRTDHGYVGAAFGLARALMAQGDRAGAIDVLREVPGSSRYSTVATLAALSAAGPAAATDRALAPGFFDRAARLDRRHPETLEVDDLTRAQVTVEVLRTAAAWAGNDRPWPGSEGGMEHEEPAEAEEAAEAAATGETATATIPPVPPDELLGLPLEPRRLRDGIEAACRRVAALTHDTARRTAWVDRANAERNWSLW